MLDPGGGLVDLWYKWIEKQLPLARAAILYFPYIHFRSQRPRISTRPSRCNFALP